MKWLITILILSGSFCASAQTGKKFTVSPGQRISEVIPKDAVYKYPSFMPGSVLLRDGTFGSGILNYNSLLGEMQFIDPKGDTLSLADEKNISVVAIKKDSFYYNDGCIELLANYGDIKLAAKRMLGISDRRKSGGLNQSGSGEIETFTTFSSRQSFKDLTMTETLTFTEKTFYYFGDRFNNFLLANKKNLLKMYGEHKTKLSDYLDQSKVDFRNADDMKKLCTFLQQF